MICTLYTLMSKYRNKKIYIWDINRDSIDVFTKAAFSRIDIQGFVTFEEEYAGVMYMNRPIVTYKQIEQEDNIILVDDKVSKGTINMLPSEKVIYWSDSLEINDELRKKKIIVYGTGLGAEQLNGVLEKEGLEAQLYCVAKKNDNIVQYRGKKVIQASELKSYDDCAILIAVINERYRKEILEILSDFRGQIYVKQENIIARADLTNLIQNIDFAVKNNKEIYLYSKKNAIAKWMEEVLFLYNIEVRGYVYDMEDKGQNVVSIYALACEGIENKLININEELQEHLIRARENIELAGFSLEKGNYTGLQRYTAAKERMLPQDKVSMIDPLTGSNTIYKQGKPGWKIYGKEAKDSIKILILGGSTSSEEYHPENWVSKLYYKLKQNGIETVFYNGAYAGDDIVTEILRLLRDGYVLQPQVVISMSGVNNTCYKDGLNQFNEERLINWVKALSPHREYCSGIYSDESLYSFWSRNIKLLKLISEFLGAKFFGFLQPMNITMDYMTLQEKSLFELEKHKIGSRNFMESANDGEDYTNLMRLFEHQNEMYFDMCHYTDKAHEVIADKVCEIVMPEIQALM